MTGIWPPPPPPHWGSGQDPGRVKFGLKLVQEGKTYFSSFSSSVYNVSYLCKLEPHIGSEHS